MKKALRCWGGFADKAKQEVTIKFAIVGASRGIGLSLVKSGLSEGHEVILLDRIMKPLLPGTIYEDKDRQESIIKESDTNWLIVRPGFLTNGPGTTRYRVIDDLTNITAGKISRLDVADFILEQLVTPTHFKKTPIICYA